jgi:hypothetical protein
VALGDEAPVQKGQRANEEMLLLDGTIPYNGANDRPKESRGGEYAKSYPAINGAPDIRKDASYDGQWSGTKDAREESTD